MIFFYIMTIPIPYSEEGRVWILCIKNLKTSNLCFMYEIAEIINVLTYVDEYTLIKLWISITIRSKNQIYERYFSGETHYLC